MFVGALKLDLQILESRSLKEKRMVLRRIKDRVRDRLGLVVAEVGDHELWQRAQLGVATVSGDRGKVMELLDAACRCTAGVEGAEILAQWRDVSSFEGELVHERRDAGDGFSDDDRSDADASSEGARADAQDGGNREPFGGEPGERAGRRGRANNDAEWLPPEWQRMLDEEPR